MHKTKIRKNVFETNSSSSHSLTMSGYELTKQPFPTSVLRAGTVSIYKGDYGWEWHRYYGAQEKMNYLLTQLVSDIDGRTTKELRDDDGRIDMMCRVVQEHTGVEVHISDSTGYIDHESVGNGLEVFESEEKLRNFLFSDDNYIETGNDNSGPAWVIQTDRGEEFYYQDHFWEPSVDNVEVKLKLTSTWNMKLETEKGVELSKTSKKELHDLIRSKGTVMRVDWTTEGRESHFRYGEPRGDTARILAGDDGMRFSPNLEVTEKLIPGKDWPTSSAVLTVSVPQEVADQLKKLRAPRKKAVAKAEAA